jgi:hypothetical protein
MVPSDMTALARDLHIIDWRAWDFAGAVNFVEGMAVRTDHSGPEVDVRTQAMLFRSIDPWSLSAAHEG